MKIYLIAVGKKMPEWINTGYSEFSKRMPPELQLNLVEVTPSIRNKATPTKKNIKEDEGSADSHWDESHLDEYFSFQKNKTKLSE